MNKENRESVCENMNALSIQHYRSLLGVTMKKAYLSISYYSQRTTRPG
jgi:hypothetical protein